MHLKNLLWTGGKLLVTGAVVAGIAFGVGVLEPNLAVQESDADIVSFGRKEVTPTEKFVASMEDLGHSKPQAFNLNGNVVYFATRLHDQSPEIVREEYMKKFREKGLAPNASKYEDEDQSIMTAWNGGVITFHESEDRIFMGGMLPVKQVSSPDELEALAETYDGQPWELYKGFHNVELLRSGDGTIATSSWSDANFDYEKMLPGNDKLDQNVDLEVPSCPGCERVSAFEDLDPQRVFRSNVYQGSSSPQHLMRFYDQALTQRGWRPTETTHVMERIYQNVEFEGKEALKRQYEKDGEVITILSHPSEDGTGATAHTVVSN
jgi:hypothetical protein